MSIDFLCPGCQEQLRVPESAAGKNAKCPSCATILEVPLEDDSDADMVFSSLSDSSAPPAKQLELTPTANPFADSVSIPSRDQPHRHPSATGNEELNPYASPSAYDTAIGVHGDWKLENRTVTVGTIWNKAYGLWQRHLGLLLGVTIVAAIVQIGFELLQRNVAFTLRREFGLLAPLMFEFVSLFAKTFLFIGQVQICLKLCRREPAEFADLFRGGGQFLPAIAAVLLVTIPFYVFAAGLGLAMARDGDPVIGIAVVLLIFLVSAVFHVLFWPYFYLIVDGKSKALESFGKALRITDGNRATTVLIGLVSIILFILGALACLVGLLFVVPLIQLLWTTAYLMMSGQMASEGIGRYERMYRG